MQKKKKKKSLAKIKKIKIKKIEEPRLKTKNRNQLFSQLFEPFQVQSSKMGLADIVKYR